MKKIFFFALASLALASCSQDEEFVAEKSNGSSRANGGIAFSTYTAGATRADVVTSAEVKASGFQINAVYGGNMYISNDKATAGYGYNGGIIDKQENIFDTEGNTYYWPIDIASDKAMDFYAFNILGAEAPKTAASFVTPVEVGQTAANQNKVAYTVAEESKDQQDLVVAHAKATEKPTDGVQPLNFTHALSKVNFSFVGADKNEKYDYIVRKIEVLATKGEGICTIASDKVSDSDADRDQPNEDGTTQSNMVVWNFEGTTATVPTTGSIYTDEAEAAGGMFYNYTLAEDVTANGTTATSLTNNLMLYPSTGRVAIRVYYKVVDKTTNTIIGNCGYDATTIKNSSDEDVTVYGYKTVILDLSGTKTDDSEVPATIPSWVAGKAYRYTLTLPIANFLGDKDENGIADDLNDADGSATDDLDYTEFDTATPIRFSVTVSDWENYSPDNNNVTIK